MCSIIGYLGSSISAQDLRAGFDKTISRGPDDTRMLHIGAAMLGFHRLAIMGLHPEGMQPFTRDGSALVCNGEIYGFRPIRERLIAEGETFESESDCEILLPLYEHGSIYNRDPDRPKRLLMHRREITKLYARTKQDGLTLVPLSLYFKDSRVKVELGLCKGKKLYDKRDAAAERSAKREIDRTIKEKNYQ